MDYISREDALRIVNVADIDTIRLEDVKRITNKCAKGIKVLPAADVVERKRGEWIHDYHYGLALPEHKCSICGEWEYSDKESNYCPNCGADMREESND